MMKKNIVMAISLGCVALVLTMLMFTQFKTVDKTDIMAIETMRESELKSELATWKSQYEELDVKLQEKEQKIQEYKDELNNEQNASTLLESEVKEAESYLGYTDMQGEGIVVTLADKDIFEIVYSDILRLVNELNSGGAEAISVNDERIASMSDITAVNNSIILVNTNKISGPYVVKAIGDKKYLESAINIKGGYIDQIKGDGKEISYKIEDNVVIPALDEKGKEKDRFEYSHEYKEQEGDKK